MVFKDTTLLQEAYISATQKTVNVPSAVPQLEPDQEANPVVLSVNTDPVPNSEPQGCGCGGDEESEENYMVLSNLFSLFSNAKKLHKFTMSGMDLEPWMQQKIAVCTDNLEAVMRSAHYDAVKAGICD